MSIPLNYLNIHFDPVITTSSSSSFYFKDSFGLDAAAPEASPPSGQGRTWGVFKKLRESERNHTSEEEQEEQEGGRGGGLLRSVLICIWGCDVWREGRISKRWSVERHTRSRVSALREAPRVQLTEAAFVWLGNQRERERGRESKRRKRRRVERLLVWSEWGRAAEWAPSRSLFAHEQDNFVLDLRFPTADDDGFTVNERHCVFFFVFFFLVDTLWSFSHFCLSCSTPPWFFGLLLLVLRFCCRRSSAYQLLDGTCTLTLSLIIFFFFFAGSWVLIRWTWLVNPLRSGPGRLAMMMSLWERCLNSRTVTRVLCFYWVIMWMVCWSFGTLENLNEWILQ